MCASPLAFLQFFSPSSRACLVPGHYHYRGIEL
jgi:hypothetical protein